VETRGRKRKRKRKRVVKTKINGKYIVVWYMWFLTGFDGTRSFRAQKTN
jgi:hypothetical protein